METTVLSGLVIYSILGLPVLLSAFLVGNGQIQAFATPEAGNTTEIAGTTEITIEDMNGTEVLTSRLNGLPCWQTPEGEVCGEWPGLEQVLRDMAMNITMKDPTGREIIRFENITVTCSQPEGTAELVHCTQD